MYAVKVVLLPPPPGPVVSHGAAPPDGTLGERWVEDVARLCGAAPRPGIAHVSPARWGTSFVAMTFAEAATLDEATHLARRGWEYWLDLPGPLSGWTLGGCAPDRYLSAPWGVRPSSGAGLA
ncbi:hypothetical protein [Streptomyces sp. NPDC018693]|uniref:hypothetical protein n=1 Tax=unclassified Streptomyces TaxID=2593676 RepID=UPI003796EBB7